MADTPFGLGRRYAPDPRDELFPMRALLAPTPLPPTPVFWLPRGGPLNQGQHGTCVGFGEKLWLLAPPVRDARTAKPSALDIYRGACLNDEWPDNDSGNLDMGTSVRGALKWLQSQGRIGAYHWSTSAADVDAYLATSGCVVIGTSWTDAMFDVDASGFLHFTGKVVGGHCVCLIGRDPQKGAVMGQCAWGIAFGIKDPKTGRGTSRFWLSGEDLQKMLDQQGEAAAAAEVRVKAA